MCRQNRTSYFLSSRYCFKTVIDEFSDIKMQFRLILGSVIQRDPREGATNSDIWEAFREVANSGQNIPFFLMKNKDLGFFMAPLKSSHKENSFLRCSTGTDSQLSTLGSEREGSSAR